jgi:hypothetical protein
MAVLAVKLWTHNDLCVSNTSLNKDQALRSFWSTVGLILITGRLLGSSLSSDVVESRRGGPSLL